MLERRFLAVVVILGVGLPAFFIDLGQEVRLDGREIIHAEISREMAETGDYTVPCRLGTPYIDKPPLFNWIVATLFELTGRSDFAVARFPAALSALAVMMGIYVLGKRWFGARAGLWAALMWPTFLLADDWAGMARGDMLLAALTFGAILFADLSAAATRPRASGALWCAASLLICGAVMSKGLQALVFFAIPVAGIWQARRSRWVPPGAFLLVTALMVVAAVAGWSWAAEVRHPGHMRLLLHYEFGEGLKEHPRRLGLYLDQIVLTTLPWSIFALGAVAYTIRRLRRTGYGAWAVPAVTFAVCVVMLTLFPNKRAHYALPVLPMWALFLSAFMDAGASRAGAIRPAGQGGDAPEGGRLFRWSFEWPLRAVLLCAVALTLAASFYWPSHVRSGKAIGVALLIAAAVPAAYGLVASWRGDSARAVGALLGTAVFLTVTAPPLATHFYLRPLDPGAIAEIARAIPPDAKVGECNVPDELLYLKMNRPVTFLHDMAELRAFLDEPGERYLIARAEDIPVLARMSSRPIRQLGMWPLGGKGEIEATVLAIAP